MAPSSSEGRSRPMNDSMRSVADIPGDDADDDLSGISPELVLVDPELARLVREREPAPVVPRLLRLVAGPRPAATPDGPPKRPETALPEPSPDEESLAPDAAAPVVAEELVVPRSTVPAPPETPVVRVEDDDVTVEIGRGAEDAIVDSAPVDATTTEPEPLAPDSTPAGAGSVPVTPRIVEAEPAWLVEPQPEPSRESVSPPQIDEPLPLLAASAVASAMPHPVARPAGPARVERRTGRRRGRGPIAFVVAVAIASLATLGILNVTGGSSTATPGPAAGLSGGKPSAPSTRRPKAGPTREQSAAARAKAQAAARTKAAARAKAAAEAKAAARAKAAAKAKAAARAKTLAKVKAAAKTKDAVAKGASAKAAAAAAAKKAQPASPAAEARRFAWAPVDGATGYHVELFKGADRVLARDTTQPILELAPTWRFEGKVVRLTPGTYRWYVWPVTKSGRATQAVVQAKLSIP